MCAPINFPSLHNNRVLDRIDYQHSIFRYRDPVLHLYFVYHSVLCFSIPFCVFCRVLYMRHSLQYNMFFHGMLKGLANTKHLNV